MNSATEAKLSRTEFEASLKARLAAHPGHESRFIRLVESGLCPRRLIQRFAINVHSTATHFLGILTDLIRAAPDAEARLILLENLMEEQGVLLRRHEGLVVRSDQAHPALALRFVFASGLGLDALPKSAVAEQMLEGVALLECGRWLEAVSFLLLGQEAGFSDISQRLFHGLQRCGLSERDLAFFAVHGEADCKHGQQAFALVLDRAQTRRQQEACLAAAEAGAMAYVRFNGSAQRSDRARAAA